MSKGPKYAFIKEHNAYGTVLIPEMRIDEAALDGIANGERVRVEIKQFRNLDRLRAWWAYLQDCIDACGLDDWTLEALADFVKIETGHVELFQLPGGGLYKRAKSIAFTSKMNEAEFVQFFRATEKLLAEKFGYSREEEIK